MPVQKNKSILFITNYPKSGSPGQRFRYELFEEELLSAGYQLTFAPFFSKKTNQILYKAGVLKKVFGVIQGAFRRGTLLFNIPEYDWVFLYRESMPLGPPVFEWLLSKVFKKQIIFDFDDAIWLLNYADKNAWIKSFKCPKKFNHIAKWATRVSCGNTYLAEKAKIFNKDVRIIPTVVDLQNRHKTIKTHLAKKTIHLGWTGSSTTLKYLKPIVPLLQKLDKKLDFAFVVIADQKPKFEIPHLIFKAWCKDTEIEDLLHIDIGLMPLENNNWTKGKCGFKAIQYSALGIPSVVSNIGVNSTVVLDGLTGFCYNSDQEFITAIIQLSKDVELRKKMGKEARRHIEQKFSKASQHSAFLALFEDVNSNA